jgi:Universal stress protein family
MIPSIMSPNGQRRVPAGHGPAGEQNGTQPPAPPPERPGRRVAVIVDGSPGAAPALRQAAAQARQRNAVLDVICLLPDEADTRAATLARVWLGEFTRRECPLGVGTPVRLRVEHGDLAAVLPVIRSGVELLVTVAEAGTGPGALSAAAAAQAAVRPHSGWLRALRHAPA